MAKLSVGQVAAQVPSLAPEVLAEVVVVQLSSQSSASGCEVLRAACGLVLSLVPVLVLVLPRQALPSRSSSPSC